MKKIIIIAWPNGAGKTTFERVYRDAVDAWAIYDNAGDEPVLTNWGEKP